MKNSRFFFSLISGVGRAAITSLLVIIICALTLFAPYLAMAGEPKFFSLKGNSGQNFKVGVAAESKPRFIAINRTENTVATKAIRVIRPATDDNEGAEVSGDTKANIQLASLYVDPAETAAAGSEAAPERQVTRMRTPEIITFKPIERNGIVVNRAGGNRWAQPDEEALQELSPVVRMPGGKVRHQWPVDPLAQQYISSGYGYRIHPVTKRRAFHKGVDIAAPLGTRVLASAEGVVTAAKTEGALGRHIKILHRDGSTSIYGHLATFKVRPGQKVRAGMAIGTIGLTGRTTGPHLHYAIKQPMGDTVNPMAYLPRSPHGSSQVAQVRR
jgi:murein DD-endopeptidase MepM/ murein hydrolase activator NlpD